MKMIDIARAILSVGTLGIQILALVNLWQIYRFSKKESNAEKENTHSETPKWVEEFIDEYMANAEIDNYQ